MPLAGFERGLRKTLFKTCTSIKPSVLEQTMCLVNINSVIVRLAQEIGDHDRQVIMINRDRKSIKLLTYMDLAEVSHFTAIQLLCTWGQENLWNKRTGQCVVTTRSFDAVRSDYITCFISREAQSSNRV